MNISQSFPAPVGNSAILIVEDDVVNAKFTSMYLKHYYKVETALDGSTALALAQSKKYAVILMDINLGRGMNGLEVTREIRKLDGYDKIPIIGISAFSLTDELEKEIGECFYHYLPKPYSSSELLEIIRKIPT
ncbi:MAG: response regulator [Ignavibacteria bacterium]|nr:response regulator [Ignavibacteria bacterium]